MILNNKISKWTKDLFIKLNEEKFKKQPHKGVDIFTNLEVKLRLYSSTNPTISGKRRSDMDSNLNL
ncbi:hypothetical protein BpHYR1_021342 [Brachionus plicatilis]|uniref:Uncharacterized protein n=1 Tax=Brachionus plicatilis TaxID=10195 RepID=A0A3M7Q9A5_BRAPC|nr:hypothetical protein BpHYR1_021342 [Brachionus plicatilis]